MDISKKFVSDLEFKFYAVEDNMLLLKENRKYQVSKGNKSVVEFDKALEVSTIHIYFLNSKNIETIKSSVDIYQTSSFEILGDYLVFKKRSAFSSTDAQNVQACYFYNLSLNGAAKAQFYTNRYNKYNIIELKKMIEVQKK